MIIHLVIPVHYCKQGVSIAVVCHLILYTCLGSSWHPSFNGSCQIFILDFCPTYGHICLVCSKQGIAIHILSICIVIHDIPFLAPCGQHSVWLLDLSLYWHYLCSSFSAYLRLAIAHLGLKQWPYALTSMGLSPQHEAGATKYC